MTQLAVPVRHPVDPEDEPARGQAAEVAVALDEEHVRADARGGVAAAQPAGPPPTTSTSASACDGHLARLLANRRVRRFPLGPLIGGSAVREPVAAGLLDLVPALVVAVAHAPARLTTSTVPLSPSTRTQSPVRITSSGSRSRSVTAGTRVTTTPSATFVVITLKTIALAGAVP